MRQGSGAEKIFWECNLEGVSWKGTKSVQGEVDDPEVGKTGELAELQTLNLVGAEVDDLDVGQAELLHVGDLVVVQPEEGYVGWRGSQIQIQIQI